MKVFEHAPKKFVMWYLLLPIVLVCLVVVFNILIDPYGIFRVVSIQGINSEKPSVTSNLRLSKAHAAHYFKLTAAIFGTSRAEKSIDPEHPGFKALGYHTYNMAMAGGGLYEIYRTLQHTYYASNRKLKLAIIGLDFLMFNANREEIVFGTEILNYDEKRLMLSPSQSYFTTTFLFDIDSILLKTAARSSVSTILQQDSKKESEMRRLHPEAIKPKELYLSNGMRRPEKVVLFPHRVATISNEKYYMEKVWTAGPEQRFCTSLPGDRKSTFDTLRNIINFSRKNNIELRFFMSPTHARALLAIKEAGLWDAFEEVKRGTVDILAEDAARYPNLKPIVLWDFMNFNTITTEPFPELSDHNSKMQWYWEMSHYKIATGNLILDRVMNYKESFREVPSDFGVLLTKNNIETHLQETLSDSETYEKQFPQYLSEIQKSAAEVFSKRPGSMCSNSYKLLYKANIAREKKNEPLAMALLTKAESLQRQEQEAAHARHLPYRETSLASLIQRSLAGYQIERPLSSWIAYQERGLEKSKQGDLKGAVLDFTEAIQRGPQNTALQYLRGSTLAQLGEHRRAIKDFKTILVSEPENKTVQTLLKQSEAQLSSGLSWIAYQTSGLEKIKLGDLKGAIRDFTQAIQRGPKNTALYFLRGTTFAKLNEHVLAIKDYEIILAAEPENQTVKSYFKQSQLALSNNKPHQPEQSVSLLDWTVFQERGLEKIKNGDLEGAVVDFTQAIKNGPKNNALYYMRGTTLAKLKKYGLAIRDLKSILKDEPNNETVKFVLKQCQASLPAKDSRHA